MISTCKKKNLIFSLKIWTKHVAEYYTQGCNIHGKIRCTYYQSTLKCVFMCMCTVIKAGKWHRWLRLTQRFSVRTPLPLGGTWQCLATLFVAPDVRTECYWHWWVEAGDVSKQLTRHRTVFVTKDDPAPSVRSAAAEKFFSG